MTTQSPIVKSFIVKCNQNFIAYSLSILCDASFQPEEYAVTVSHAPGLFPDQTLIAPTPEDAIRAANDYLAEWIS